MLTRARAVWMTAVGLAPILASASACVGEDPDIEPNAIDAGGLADASDDRSEDVPRRGPDGDGSSDGAGLADGDANVDAASACKPTPQSCTDTMQTCVNNCRVTYNICKNECPQDANLMSCIQTCKNTLATCQVPCKGDCTTCANANGSCTGSADCSAIIYVE